MKVEEIGVGLTKFSQIFPDVKMMQKRVQDLNQEAQFRYDDEKTKGTLWRHNDAFFQKIHQIIHNEVRSQGHLTNAQPTYNFLLQYPPGSKLLPHTDRADCEFNLSFIIKGTSKLFTDNCKEGVELGENEALLYSGFVPHWREASEDYLCVCIFHFKK
ncbi:MAG: hypothetical protein ACJ76H_11220 [Bacteriovoracaceae bacterium]